MAPEGTHAGGSVAGYVDMVDMLVNVCNDTEIIILLDLNGMVINISNATAKRHKKTREEIIHTSIWNLLPPEAAAHRQEVLRRVVDSGRPVCFEDAMDGRWHESWVYPLKADRGQIRHVLVLGRDVTRRKCAEAALQKMCDDLGIKLRVQTEKMLTAGKRLEREVRARLNAEAQLHKFETQYRPIVETTSEAVVLSNLEGRITAWNQGAEIMFGYAPDEIIGQSIWLLSPAHTHPVHHSHYRRFVEEQTGDFSYRAIEGESLRKDGTVIMTEHSMSVCQLGDERYVTSIFRDVTQRKYFEQLLQEREQELQTKNQTLEELNAALNVLLNQRTNDRNDLQEKILSNVRELVWPYVEKLQGMKLELPQRECLNIIRNNLENIVSPFIRTLSAQYMKLTPREIQIASMIREGKTTKEIAMLMNVSFRTVDAYRDKIRKKLGLNNKKANLRTYLMSIQS